MYCPLGLFSMTTPSRNKLGKIGAFKFAGSKLTLSLAKLPWIPSDTDIFKDKLRWSPTFPKFDNVTIPTNLFDERVLG